MSFLLATLQKDLSRWWLDKASMLIWLGVPLLIGGLLTLMVSGGGGKPGGVLLLADEDETFLSGLVAGAFSQGELGELISVEPVANDEGRRRIEAGEASAFLLIPEGFSAAFLDATPVVLTLKTNPSQSILPGIIEDVTEILLDAGFYAQQILGDELRAMQDSTADSMPTELVVADIAVRVQNKIEAVAPILLPPLFEIDIVEPPPAEPQPDIALLFLPGIVLMAILFAANSLAADYWQERSNGTLRRLVSAPGVLTGFVIGKALASACIFAALALLTLAAGFAFHDVAWNKLGSSLAWVALSGIGLFAWFAALQMLFKTRKAANLVSTILVFPLLMVGGSFFPLDALPESIASLGRLSPNGFMADRLTVELSAASAWSFGSSSWMINLAIAASGLLLCMLRLRGGFARGGA
ncbi:MAG: ABC transporter permease [Woeseiaceae bacterium]